MERCKRKKDLQIHHKRVDGGNEINNAQVLCEPCHKATASHSDPNHTSPQPFTQSVKDEALKLAGNQCQCTKGQCCDSLEGGEEINEEIGKKYDK